jgi:hypothetical protein
MQFVISDQHAPRGITDPTLERCGTCGRGTRFTMLISHPSDDWLNADDDDDDDDAQDAP